MKRQVTDARRSRQTGSMLILACAIGILIVVGMVFAINMGKFFVHHIHDQSVSDSLTLKAAMLLNADDRAGKMNNLVIQSRELVYDSRAAYNATLNANYSHLEPLAYRLLHQARWGAQFVDKGRQRLIEENIRALKTLVASDLDLKNHGASVTALEVGSVADTRSNVYDDEADELQSLDRQKRWIDPETKRFNGNINATLPDEDQDLTFKVSPLHAPNNGKMVQASLISANEFVKTATVIEKDEPKDSTCDQLPSAVRLNLAYPDRVTKEYGDVQFKFSSAASTNGAQLVP